MDKLHDLLAENETWVLERVVEYAKKHDYARHTSTLVDAWRASITAITGAILDSLYSAEPIPELDSDARFHETAVDQFSKEEVRRHRGRGVTLGMFLGLVKYYRQSYLDLVREAGFPLEEERRYLARLERFFDRFEISYSVEWNSLSFDEKLEELQAQNRAMTNEKNKYLTVFESLYDPVVLLDSDNRIENINQAAAELFQQHSLRGHRYYDRHPVAEAFPWLDEELALFSAGREREVVLEKAVETQRGERYFQVKMKRMLDISDKYRGSVLILNDLTERRKKEEALVLTQATQRWVDTLVDIGHGISRMGSTEEIIPVIVSSARNLLDTSFAALGLWDEVHRTFEVRFLATPEGPRETAVVAYRCSKGQESGSPEETCSCLADIGRQIYREVAPGEADSGSTAGIALKVEGRVAGALWVGRPKEISPLGRAVLDSLANQAAIALEHSEMASRIQSLAVLEERARIAREMHDGLAQLLGFLNLEMQSLSALVQQDRRELALAELTQARRRILEAHAELRENIVSLRTALSKDRRAIPAMQEHLREFAAQTGITVHVSNAIAGPVDLSSTAEVQLVRTMQEALANVRLHAQAQSLRVRFTSRDDRLSVEVADDGVGFQVQEACRHFGLQSMRERLHSVGGSLVIDSSPGKGTTLRFLVPLEPEAAAAPVRS